MRLCQLCIRNGQCLLKRPVFELRHYLSGNDRVTFSAIETSVLRGDKRTAAVPSGCCTLPAPGAKTANVARL